MSHNFKIRFHMRTLTEYEPLCDFYIGNNREVALALFQQLDGSDEALESDILQLDFIEMLNGLPLNVKIKHCTSVQMTTNCSLITREMFKYRNLNGRI